MTTTMRKRRVPLRVLALQLCLRVQAIQALLRALHVSPTAHARERWTQRIHRVAIDRPLKAKGCTFLRILILVRAASQ